MASSTASESGGLLRCTRRSASTCCASASVSWFRSSSERDMRSSSSICSSLCSPYTRRLDGARLGVGSDGVHVVVGLVIVVAEARQRGDGERRERPVDGAIDLDRGEIVLGGQLVLLRLPMRVGEARCRLRRFASSCGRTARCCSRRASRWRRSDRHRLRRGPARPRRRRAARRASAATTASASLRRRSAHRVGLREAQRSRSRRTRATRAATRAPRARPRLSGRGGPHRWHSIPINECPQPQTPAVALHAQA